MELILRNKYFFILKFYYSFRGYAGVIIPHNSKIFKSLSSHFLLISALKGDLLIIFKIKSSFVSRQTFCILIGYICLIFDKLSSFAIFWKLLNYLLVFILSLFVITTLFVLSSSRWWDFSWADKLEDWENLLKQPG